MERKRKNFWLLSLSILFVATPTYASNNLWDGLIKQLFKKSKSITLTAGRETLPTLKLSPKVMNFKGVLEIPQHIHITSGYGSVGNTSGQLIFDGEVICNYSPASNNILQNRIYVLKSCSNGYRSKDDLAVNSKVELRLNNAQSDRAYLQASLKVIRQDEISYGLVFPYIQAEEGQVLMYNGEAWIPVDVSELALNGGGNGEPGEIGPIGPQGPAGDIGATGPQGLPGAKGEKGDKGDKGEKGEAGSPGVAGAKGEAGSAGAVGATGPQGPAGATGAIGPQGPAGATGAIGPQGPAGAKGDIGPQGPAGEKGDIGPQGLAGAKGDTGPQGLAGAKGDTGAQGPVGAKGDIGAQGPAGEKGDIGPQGLPGLPGEQGPAGIAGATGPQGPKGDSGASEIAYLREERASGTNGGTCEQGIWQTRNLNTLGGDNSFVTLSNNRFTLQPGKYFIEVHAPGYSIAQNQAKLKVIESNSDVLYGSIMVSHPTSPSTTHSIITGEIVVSVASTFEIQHRCANSKVTFGFGIAANFGTPEIYTQVKIIKK